MSWLRSHRKLQFGEGIRALGSDTTYLYLLGDDCYSDFMNMQSIYDLEGILGKKTMCPGKGHTGNYSLEKG